MYAFLLRLDYITIISRLRDISFIIAETMLQINLSLANLEYSEDKC